MHPDDSYGDVRPVDTQDIGRSVSLVKFSLSAGISHEITWVILNETWQEKLVEM